MHIGFVIMANFPEGIKAATAAETFETLIPPPNSYYLFFTPKSLSRGRPFSNTNTKD